MSRSLVIAALSLAPSLLLTACGVVPFEDHRPRLRAFTVQLSSGQDQGTQETPLGFPSTVPARFDLVLTAVDVHGTILSDYDQAAVLSVVPGLVAAEHRRVRFERGLARTSVEFRFSYGPTRIWVEDAGESVVSDCENGLDDDHDGVSDAADPDCQKPEGKLESALATMATGISAPIYFAEPRIRDLQFSPRCTTDTPLGGTAVVVGHGALVCTGITQSGLYVTDMNGPEGGYNSVFLFTFSNPGGVRPGDRLCEIAGNAAEFIGNTQLNFPSYLNAETGLRQGDGDVAVVPCTPEPVSGPITGNGPRDFPRPHLLEPEDVNGTTGTVPDDFYRVCAPGDLPIAGLDDATDCAAARNALPAEVRRQSPIDCARDNFAMEPWEHALVALRDAKIGHKFVDCDENGDGRIDFRGPEGDCATTCSDDALCTEISSLTQYGQFAVGLGCTGEGDLATCKAKVYLATRDTLGKSGYDVMEHKGEQLACVNGHLRQTQPGAGVDSIWIIEPRDLSDIGSGECPQ
ncbi:MAG: hypothetical protein EXR76_10680 [Myxococcales bacterium]|nr:hypothetical protein [Myxococcales bacterium]